MSLSVIDLGLISFKESFSKQIQIHNQVLSGSLPHTLILCEHPHTITLSRRTPIKNILDYNFIKQNDVDFIVGLNRGGDITYHGPGQLMGYLIFDLRKLSRDLGLFLENVEKAILGTIESFGIKANIKAGYRGVWVNPSQKSPGFNRRDERKLFSAREEATAFRPRSFTQKKIASIGIGVEKWVSLHGFALNINTNLIFFDIIKPCGMDIKMTSMEKELGFSVSVEEVKERIIREICSLFGLVNNQSPRYNNQINFNDQISITKQNQILANNLVD